ncbi:hypothetical protein H6G17_12545 [Chroococcidiopsis sp. FACHB-1243]|uniref:hypothetical protein n=1 Tax=Chroococcidiopsis sp. [FACHB-1243] TaxID=2692781 RepID=UPI00177D9ABB|nr:hypothetical protein [Chroococcidiopsis sp. [FACHB-1243]]MBD2306339.1 hypothetical protein [Chroococcidiopsis sp. [FACHB-1243]]
MKDKILTNKENSRLNLYGGCFDLVNGTFLSNKISSYLKFAALFYDKIIVPDGFFHCYGSLSCYFTEYIKDPNNTRNLDIVNLLEAGIIVPALRQGESLYDNWINGEDIGIIPGEHLILNKDDGADVLGYIDEKTSCYMHWPNDMAKANRIEFSTLLYDFLVNEESSYSLLNQRTLPDSSPECHVEWMQCEYMLDELCSSISDNRYNPKFRRGNIEDIIRRHLEIEMKSYDEIKSRVSETRVDRNLKFAIGYYFLNLTTTIYEAYHANQFHTVGGLFPQHEDMLIDRGLYDNLVELTQINTEYQEKRVLFGSLDVSRLTMKQIIAFRSEKEELFQEYCKQVRKIEFLGVDKFQETNSEFIEFLINQYVPEIIKKYPNCGYIENTLASAEAIVKLTSDNHLVNLEIAGLSLATYIGAINLAVKFIPPIKLTVAKLDSYIQSQLLMHGFKKNNYQRWNS